MDPQRFCAGLRALRVRRRLTQGELGIKSGVGRSKVSRIERGLIDRVPFGDLVAVARALDATVDLDLRWRGAGLDRLIDARHASLVEATVRWLTANGWTCFTEVSFSQFGERGSIDVVGRHPGGAWAVIEDKASIGEVNSTLIGIDRKARLFPAIARERGWAIGSVGVLLVVANGTTSRRRVAEHDASFRAALPTVSLECRRWIRSPNGPPPRGIVFIDVPDSHRARA